MIFGTKAETLLNLSSFCDLKYARILPQITFTHKQWKSQRELIQRKLAENKWAIECTDCSVIVRSSAINEDTALESKAGQYESVLDVHGWDEFCMSVDKVIKSYGEYNGQNQILVQPMLKDVALCGVAFTIDPSTLGNYYVINFDTTGSTFSITSGINTEKSAKLFYCFKHKRKNLDKYMGLICNCLEELEKIFEQNNLDVEFAMTNEMVLYIFQVRPICLKGNPVDICIQNEKLQGIQNKFREENRTKPFLYGNRVIYGVMPDWNPAEIIGIRPNPFALSLYKEIITDNIWAYQRNNYGYRNLRSFPLMIDFCGLPYIDVRVSFNSFIPKDLEEQLSEKLANYYLDRLAEDPSKHDKIEFEIVFSCYTLDLQERIQILKKYGFAEEEIRSILESLKKLTNTIINNDTGLWKKDCKRIEILEERYQEIMNSDMNKISKVYWLLEDCKRYGTLPFAGLARAGFIAVQFLNSMVKKSIISLEEYHEFMNELATVSSGMNQDFAELSKNAFLAKYGHLRPGTYNINSKRYDENPDLYFNWGVIPGSNVNEKKKEFKLSLNQLKMLRIMLREQGLEDDILGLFDFIRTTIESREHSKFVFTKSLSTAIKLFGEIGKEYGNYSEEECAFADINIIRELYTSTLDIKETLFNSIEVGKQKQKRANGIILPPVILEEEEIYSFYYPETQPNYITLKRTIGNICYINEKKLEKEINDKIILIANADPGYDWIFSHGIRGFITMFGGANSHMAIRAGELGIPAVIGAGELIFHKLCKAELVEIDAMAKKVTVLK